MKSALKKFTGEKQLFFCVLTLFIVLIHPFLDAVGQQIEMLLAMTAIIILGVPHGAIDHILYAGNLQKTGFKFHLLYSGLIIAYLAIWYFLPTLSMLFFLFISAYHFGQSQFADLSLKKHLEVILSLFWGWSLITAMSWFNFSDIQAFLESSSALSGLIAIVQPNLIGYIAFSNVSVTIGLLVYLRSKKLVLTKRLSLELFAMILLALSFYYYSFLLSFTIYFVIWHSLGVLRDEYGYMKKQIKRLSLQRFVHLLLPNSLISLVFAGAVLAMIYFFNFEINLLLTVFVFLSILTLPHSFVMDRFYKRIY